MAWVIENSRQCVPGLETEVAQSNKQLFSGFVHLEHHKRWNRKRQEANDQGCRNKLIELYYDHCFVRYLGTSLRYSSD